VRFVEVLQWTHQTLRTLTGNLTGLRVRVRYGEVPVKVKPRYLALHWLCIHMMWCLDCSGRNTELHIVAR
jgi:hypothetical protein